MLYRNGEHYFDPTAGEALRNVVSEEKRKNPPPRRFRPLVYVCSPYAGDTVRNIQAAQRYCRFAVSQGCIPFAAHLFFPQFLDDEKPDERKLGMALGNILMDRCQEVWFFGDHFSEGMTMELDRAQRKGYRIRYFTKDCVELTDGGGGDASV